MPNDSAPAPVGSIPFVQTTPGVLEFVPLSSAIVDVVPDNVNVYVNPTGNDTTGDGTIANPFLTLPRAIESIETTGYNITAAITVVGALPVSVGITLDLNAGTIGERQYPIVIQGQSQTVVISDTVSSVTQDAVTGQWTLVNNGSTFISADVGKQVVFTSGPLAAYQPNAMAAPTALSAFIVKYVSATTCILSFAGTTLPVAGNGFNVVSNSSSLNLVNASLTDFTTWGFGDIRLDRLDLNVINGVGDTLNWTMTGSSMTWSGVKLNCSPGVLNLSASCDIGTTYGGYPTTVVTPANNFAGLYIEGTGNVVMTSFDAGNSWTLKNCGLAGVGTNSLTGDWQIDGSNVSGAWTLSGNSLCTLTNTLVDASSTTGGVKCISGNLSVSGCKIQNSTGTGLTCDGSNVSLASSTLTNNVTHLSCTDGGTLNITAAAVSLVTGAACKQTLSIVNGGRVNVQGSLSVSTTVAPGGVTLTPIYMNNGGRLYLSSNLTVSSSPAGAMYLSGYSTVQCGVLSLTSSSGNTLQLESGSLIEAGATTLVSSGGYCLFGEASNLVCTSLTATSTSNDTIWLDYGSVTTVTGNCGLTAVTGGANLFLRDASSFTVGGILTMTGIAGCSSQQGNSPLNVGSLVASATALTGSTLYCAGNSAVNSLGAVQVTAAGDNAIVLTFNGTMNCTALTILGTATNGLVINNRSGCDIASANITAKTSAITGNQMDITCSGDIVLATLGGVGTAALGCSGSSLVRAVNLTIGTSATGITYLDSNLEVATITITGATTGISATNSNLVSSGAVNVTATNLALSMSSSSKLQAGSTVSLTASAGVGTQLRSVSILNCTGLTVNSTGTSLDTDSSNCTSSTTIALTATAGSAFAGVASTIQCTGAMTVNQTVLSTLTGCTLKAGGAASFTNVTTAIITATGCSFSFGGSLTFATTLSAASFTMTAGSLFVSGAATFASVSLTGVTFNSNSTVLCSNANATALSCVNSTFSAGGVTCTSSLASGLQINGGLFTCSSYTGSGNNTGLSCNYASFNCTGAVTCNTCNTGVTSTGGNLQINGILTATGAIANAVSLTRATLNCNGMTCNGSGGSGIVLVSSTLSSTGTINAADSTTTSFNCTSSVVRATSLVVTNTAGVNAIQLSMATSQMYLTSSIDLSRTVVGTTGSTVAVLTGSRLSATTMTFTNAGAGALSLSDSELSLSGLNSNVITGGSPHVALDNSKARILGGTIQGTGGGEAYRLTNGSNMILNGATLNTTGGGGSGVNSLDSRFELANCVISNWVGSGVLCTRTSTGTLTGVTGTGNGGTGLKLVGTSTCSTNTSTVTGTGGDVKVGNIAAQTWATIATGAAATNVDYSAGAPTCCAVVAF